MGDVKIPKGEILWERIFDKYKKLQYVVTSKSIRDYYYLYAVDGDNLKKLGKGKSPVELESLMKEK